jgi:hypothetical protein
MIGITLAQVETKGSFWFGNVRFEKGDIVDNELVECKIYSTVATVHISECAWVYIEQ